MKSHHLNREIMRYLPLFLVLLVLSAPGSVGVIEQSRTIDATKMSSELVSILDSGEKIEAIVQFYDSPSELTWDLSLIHI